MEKHEIGNYYATTFDGDVIKFIVFDDNTMDCPTLDVYSFKRIELKPRFVLWDGNKYYKYNVPANRYGECSKLIGCYDIDDDLFEYLKQNNMIRYSNDMAYLYGFKDKKGYDSVPGYYGVSSPYKRVKKKGSILLKQREGQFN